MAEKHQQFVEWLRRHVDDLVEESVKSPTSDITLGRLREAKDILEIAEAHG